MKVLYLVHQFYPKAYTGTEKFILQLAQSCQYSGHAVTVVTYDLPQAKDLPASPNRLSIKQRVKALLQKVGLDPAHLRMLLAQLLPNRISVKEYIHQGVPVLSFSHQRRATSTNPQSGDPTLLSFVRQVLLREKPDLIHAGHTLRVAEFLTVAVELGIPYLLTLTDFWVICPNCKLINEKEQICHGPRRGEACKSDCPTFRPKRIMQRLEQMARLLEQAAQVVAPSFFLAKKVEAEFGSLGLKVIPYGIDTHGLQPNTRRYPTAEPLVFLFAGALLETKGIAFLLEAFHRLPGRNARLEIYGTGAMSARVQQAAQADPCISYHGLYQTDQLSALLNRVDVVVVPSIWHENMPLIMQEAQACGVPTLVSDVGGMTECVTDGVNGLTFRVGDVADLQQKMQMIIDQPEILNRIKENMRNPKPGQYRVTSLEEEARLYLAQYGQILNTPDATVSDRQIR